MTEGCCRCLPDEEEHGRGAAPFPHRTQAPLVCGQHRVARLVSGDRVSQEALSSGKVGFGVGMELQALIESPRLPPGP